MGFNSTFKGLTSQKICTSFYFIMLLTSSIAVEQTSVPLQFQNPLYNGIINGRWVPQPGPSNFHLWTFIQIACTL